MRQKNLSIMKTSAGGTAVEIVDAIFTGWISLLSPIEQRLGISGISFIDVDILFSFSRCCDCVSM